MTDKTHIIRLQNDQFRKQIIKSIFHEQIIQGQCVMTQGIVALGPEAQIKIAVQIRDFDNFTEENDPYDEHDFGSIEYEGQKIFWKIDCYDTHYETGSEDPSNPDITRRVLTILLASEY